MGNPPLDATSALKPELSKVEDTKVKPAEDSRTDFSQEYKVLDSAVDGASQKVTLPVSKTEVVEINQLTSESAQDAVFFAEQKVLDLSVEKSPCDVESHPNLENQRSVDDTGTSTEYVGETLNLPRSTPSSQESVDTSDTSCLQLQSNLDTKSTIKRRRRENSVERSPHRKKYNITPTNIYNACNPLQGPDVFFAPTPGTFYQRQDGLLGPVPYLPYRGTGGFFVPPPVPYQRQDRQLGPAPGLLHQGHDGLLGPVPGFVPAVYDGLNGPGPGIPLHGPVIGYPTFEFDVLPPALQFQLGQYFPYF